MKKFEEMTYEELKVARRERNDAFGELCAKAANREFNAEEKQQEINLRRELAQLDELMKVMNREDEHEKAQMSHREEVVGAQFRELLQDVRKGKAEREILLSPASPGDTNNIEASGAIRLTINELIPTLHEGLGLPKGLRIVTGVEGNEVWPVSVNDVEMEEVGEVEALTDQVLDFAKITPTARRTGLIVPVSNMAIDNAAFDLMGFVQRKFEIAQREYLAKKIYSRAAWTGNHGPYKSLTKSGDIEIGPDAYKQILAAVAAFSNKGFYEGNVCLAMDAVTEAELKATPKIEGAAGGFCIENGKCCGYDYVVSHFVNTELSGTSLVPTADRYINIGYWEWFALQQHGEVRMVIDTVTGANKNVTKIVLNTAWSMTDLSTKIGNAAGTTTQAFAAYKVTHPEA
jgi:hypothetical protein